MKKTLLHNALLLSLAIACLQTFSVQQVSATCTPLTLSLAAGTSGKVTASWNAGSGSYKLYWSYLSSMITFNTIGTTSTSYTFSATGSTTIVAYIVDQGSTCSPKPQSAYVYYNVSGGSCASSAPSNLTDTVTTTTAKLTWSGSASKYQIFYKKASATSWAGYTATTNAYSLTGLSPSTCYVFYVVNRCTGAYGYSSHIDTFCTLAPCNAPSNLTATPACKGFSATWDTVKGATSYQVFISKVASGTATLYASYRANKNSFSDYMFTKGTNLQVYVEALGCNGGAAASAPSNVKSFTVPTLGCKNNDNENIQSSVALNSSVNAILSPNPCNGYFTINLKTVNTTDNAHVYIINMLGQILNEQLVNNNNGLIHSSLNNTALTTGMYLVKIQVGTESHIERMIIQK